VVRNRTAATLWHAGNQPESALDYISRNQVQTQSVAADFCLCEGNHWREIFSEEKSDKLVWSGFTQQNDREFLPCANSVVHGKFNLS